MCLTHSWLQQYENRQSLSISQSEKNQSNLSHPSWIQIVLLPASIQCHGSDVRVLLDWIGNQPTRCSFMPWSKAVAQLQTHVQWVGYGYSRGKPTCCTWVCSCATASLHGMKLQPVRWFPIQSSIGLCDFWVPMMEPCLLDYTYLYKGSRYHSFHPNNQRHSAKHMYHKMLKSCHQSVLAYFILFR